MFLELAKFRRVGPRQIMPVRCDVTHSNDNLPGFRRPAAAGGRRPPTPALACHWVERNGRLECRWQAEPGGETPIGDFDEHAATGRTPGLSPTQPRGRGLALAG